MLSFFYYKSKYLILFLFFFIISLNYIYAVPENYQKSLRKVCSLINESVAENKEIREVINQGFFLKWVQQRKNDEFNRYFNILLDEYLKLIFEGRLNDKIDDLLKCIKLSDSTQNNDLNEVNDYQEYRKKILKEIKTKISEEYWELLIREILKGSGQKIENISKTHNRLIRENKDHVVSEIEKNLHAIFKEKLSDYEKIIELKRINGYLMYMIDRFPDQLKFEFFKGRGNSKVCISCCDDSLRGNDLVDAFSCGHKLCKECLETYIRIKIKEMDPFECPECQMIADIDKLYSKNLLSTLLKTYFEFLRLRKLVRSSGHWYYCKTAGCEGGYIVEDDTQTRFTCLLCDKNQCIKCNNDHNKFISCEEFQEQLDHKDPLYLMKKKKLVKNCPKCNIAISKEMGCLHMICRECKFHFNWETLQPWKGKDWYRLQDGSEVNPEIDNGHEEEVEYH